MKFEIRRTSFGEIEYPKVYKEKGYYFININTFEELAELQKYFGDKLIIDFGQYPDIEIYDDYRE